MNTRLFLILALCWPMHAMSIGFPSFSSEIPGIQLWVLNTYESGFPEEGFQDDKNEFIRHCNGTRFIYVGSFDSPIRCKSENTGDGTYRIYLKSTDRRLSGLVVVSKSPLSGRIKSLPLTTEDTERLRSAEETSMAAFADEAKRTYLESYSDVDAAGYAKMLREIKTEATYRKHGGARFKISSPNGFIFISAIGLFPEALGWDIKNAVFREIDGRLQEIGAFLGCIEGFRDLNADGTPEVLTRGCENSEGTGETFWSLTPTVRPVVSRSQ